MSTTKTKTYVDFVGYDHTAIITMESWNTKTGNIPQVYIVSNTFLCALLKTFKANSCTRKHYWDACPNTCPHRRSDCYVRADSVYSVCKNYLKAKKANNTTMLQYFCDPDVAVVRLGTFGDPGFLPNPFFIQLRKAFPNAIILGYTHMWRERPDLRHIIMASVENEQEAHTAIKMGFRVFWCDKKFPEHFPYPIILCPNTQQKQRGIENPITCEKCRLCSGKQNPKQQVNLFNYVH